MQTAGMLRGTRAIYFLALLAPLIVDHAHSYPYQLLPSIPGYIPVYIRNGDQPLEEINPALAEAFHEHSSLSKSIRLDRNLDHHELTEDSRTNSVVDGSKKQYYPAHAREPGNAIVNNERREEEEMHLETSPGHQVPKLVSLYELHEKLKKKTQESDQSKMKEIPAKVSPILLTEKENFDKDETKPNDLYDPNPNYPELPADIGHNRDTSQDFPSVIGLDVLTEQPNIRQYKDLAHLTEERNAVDDKNEKKEEEPVKVQRPSDILSNVQKLLPIAPPEAYNTEKLEEKSEMKSDEKSKEKSESKIENMSAQEPAVLYYKDLFQLSRDQKVIESANKKEEESAKKEENSSNVADDAVLKETPKEEPPTNVLKLSPIAPPEAYKTEKLEEKSEGKSSEKSEIKTESKIENVSAQEPAVLYYKDLSQLSRDQKVIESADKKEEESAKKGENLSNAADDKVLKETPKEEPPTNVLKLSPIAPPEAYESQEKSTTEKVEEETIDPMLVKIVGQPVLYLYKDLPQYSEGERDTKTSSTVAKEENEAPVKVESSLKVPANVVKFSLPVPPEPYLKEGQGAAPSTVLMQETVQNDENKKEQTNRNDDPST